MKRERFPLEYDHEHYSRLRNLYGRRMPEFRYIRVRKGLHPLIDRFFAELGRIAPPSSNPLRIKSIETHGIGKIAIYPEGTVPGLQRLIAATVEEARTTCEHCGSPGRMVVKMGMEALLVDPEADLRSRLLCIDCAHGFQQDIGVRV